MDSKVIRHAKMAMVNPNRWIQNVTESPDFKKGAFTKKAKGAHKKTTTLMKEVLANPDKYDPTTRHQAQFMKNIMRD